MTDWRRFDVLRILRQHRASQIQRSADENARRWFFRMRAGPGGDLEHRVFDVFGGRGVESCRTRAVVKLAGAKAHRLTRNAYCCDVAREAAEGAKKSDCILRAQHPADQIERTFAALFEIRDGRGHCRRAMRI